MKAPLSWLKDFVDIDADAWKFADAMTLSGSKVEGVEVQGEDIQKVVVGRILSVEKHPDADKLQVCKVDVGSGQLQIVTGARNISEGDYVPVALHGSMLPGGKKITKGKLRGLESSGMMCSLQELALTAEDYPGAVEDGILILEGEPKPGTDIRELLGLNETVVEFEITPNRPDCLSIAGLAREAAVTLSKPLKKLEISLAEKGDDASSYASVEIKDSDLCPRYAARIVKDVKIGPSPKWMRQRLKAAGVRPINNIVDITNYVMLELGQPMHAFDLRYLSGSKIVVRRAVEGETIKTLDDQERQLDTSMLVIADAGKAVAVAGVMGGANSEVLDDTSAILFESANFNGASVRLTAKKIGLRTEASARFEKGLDPENVKTAVDRAVQLVEQLGIGTVCKGVIDCYPAKPAKRKVTFRPEKINAFLGTDISSEEMVRILNSLEIEADAAQNAAYPPSFRPDIEREADLAEEIARFHGYNNIEATLLSGKAASLGKKTHKQKIEDIIKNTIQACGHYETYTYSFTSPKVFDMLRLPEDSRLRNAVVISNPLGEDYSIMRTTTIPDMLEVISRNFYRRIDSVRLYELSTVYLPVDGTSSEAVLPVEKEVLTIGMYGEADFYLLKGVVEEVLCALGIKDYDFDPETGNPSFHPGRTARLLVNGKHAGVFGEIHPGVSEAFEAPERTYIAVIEIGQLVNAAQLVGSYSPLPRFPAVSRDIAMLVKEEVLVKQIEGIIRQRGGKIIEDIRLFDVYKGKQVPEGMKSVAYSITFRADDRTLTDDEVGKAMEKILNGLKTVLDAQLR